MWYHSDTFKPKATHQFYVKEIPIEIRRKKWREEELQKRRNRFGSVFSITPYYLKIYNFFKK
jgi:hypothetical protein